MKQRVTRREFMEGLGACAAGGAALYPAANRRATAQNSWHLSTSNSVAWFAPPTLASPNILFIIVDQMRWPQWLNSSQTQALQSNLPNIWGVLRNCSYVFGQYYTAATACVPSRGTLLTGLYAPQTGIYVTDNTASSVLNPAFPTWGDAIQTLNGAYAKNVWWFGKWHLSVCNNSKPLQPYEFRTRTYPGGAAANPSPDGSPNEGVNGGRHGNVILANDAQIAGDFIGWLQGQAPTLHKPVSPWCATVSLLNPHDIASAPAFPPVYFPKDQFPPPSGAPAIHTVAPSPWNYEDLTKVTNKPRLQLEFQKSRDQALGAVAYPDGWATFLNQYYWLQNYVDQQVGRVLTALASSSYADNTIIVFTSDHGDYGGSHGLHDKGNAVYDEGIRVPLYVKYPKMTSSVAMNQMCSSVDIFGLLCDLATNGTGQWQTTYPDLAPRQSIWNFLYHNTGETRVVPSGPLVGMPYIFHTTDESSNIPPSGPNPHVVGLRIKSGATPGGKLGVYSDWSSCTTIPNQTAQEFEFYDYTTNTAEMGNDYSSSNSTAQSYLSTLGSWGPPATGLIATELGKTLTGTGRDSKPLTQAQAVSKQAFFQYLGQTCS